MKSKKTESRKPNSPLRTSAVSTKTVLTAAPRIHINPGWAWHYRALLSLRDRLRISRGEQVTKAAEPLEPHSMDIADTATDEFDHDLALAHLSAQQNSLYEVEEALRRIRDGSYGICEETGKRITGARLKAIPWTRFCRDAQAHLEQAAVTREHLGRLASIHMSAVDANSEGEPIQSSGPADESLQPLRVSRTRRKR